MREKRRRLQEALLFLGAAVLFGAMVWLLWAYVPRREVRYGLLGICAGLFLLAALWRTGRFYEMALSFGRFCFELHIWLVFLDFD